MKRLHKNAGVALLIELMAVCMVLLILAAASLPQFVAMAQASSDKSARDRLMLVGRSSVEFSLCSSTPGCVQSAGVTAMIPPVAETIAQQGYNFTFNEDVAAPGGWHMTAISIAPGRNFWIDGSLLLRCTQDGSTPAGVSPTC
jgi:type II secretory pathway pseudopilin PulG